MTRSFTDSLSTRRRNRTARRPQAETLEGRTLLTAGDLDLSFGTVGTGGYVLTNSPALSSNGTLPGDRAYAVAIQPDGKILAAGNRQTALAFEVVRLDPNGSLDSGFGTGGRVVQLHNGPSQAYDMAVDSAGRIILAGYTQEPGGGPGNHPQSDVALVRLLDTGAPDPSFGPNGDGKVVTDLGSLDRGDTALAVAIQTDGKIVVGGHAGGVDPNSHDGLLLRYNAADGSLDESFGVAGKVVTSWATNRDDRITGVAIQADGKIVVCGSVKLEDGSGRYGRYLARYNAEGTLDSGFGSGGGGRVDLPFSTSLNGHFEHPIAIQQDGAIVWAGYGFNGTDDDVAVARLTTTGAFDTTFGAPSGSARTGSATIPLAGRNGAGSVTIQEDGKLVVVGLSGAPNLTDSLIARFEADGTLDSGFGSGGLVVRSFSSGSTDILYDVAIQGDGKLVAVGVATPPDLTQPAFLIARFEGQTGPGITVSPTSGLVTSESGGTANFSVVLSTQPTADVTIPVTSGNADEGAISASPLTFTAANWNVPQTVTVTGVDDPIVDGDIPYTILLGVASSFDLAYNSLDPADVAVTNTDNDNPTKFYVVNDGSPDRTYEYGPTGSAVENYGLGSANTAPRGAASTTAGDKVWVVDANKTVYVYNTAGGLLGSWTAGSLASNATVEGIATNGTDVWIVDARQDKVFRYTNAAGRLSGSQNAASSFALNSGNTSPKDVVTDGTSLWVVNDSTTDKVFKYATSGSLLGSWTITGAGSSPTGITLDPSGGGTLWTVDSGTDRVYQFDNARSLTSGSLAPSTSFALAAGNTNPQGIADPPTPALGASRAAAVTRGSHPSADLAAQHGGTIPVLRTPRWAGSPLPRSAARPSIQETPILIPLSPPTDHDLTLLARERLHSGTKRTRFAPRV